MVTDKPIPTDGSISFRDAFCEHLEEVGIIGKFPCNTKRGKSFRNWEYLGSFGVTEFKAFLKRYDEMLGMDTRILIFQKEELLYPAVIFGDFNLYLAPRWDTLYGEPSSRLKQIKRTSFIDGGTE